MNKPQTFKKPVIDREMRLAKAATAAEAIGKIEHNQDVYILTFGQFSLIDALVAILDQVGPAEVDISTWTAADAHLQQSIELMEAARITKFRMIVDRSFETRQPGYCYHMRKLFGPECLRAVRTHAKFMVIRAKNHKVVVRTSMNLNENPRLENIEVSESGAFCDWFTTIVDSLFQTVEEGQNRSALPDITIPEYFPFTECEAQQIERHELNEATYSHTLKKL